MKLCVIFARIGPYHFARLEALAERAQVTAIELSCVDSVYAWDQVTQAGHFKRRTLFENLDFDPDLENAEALPLRLQEALDGEAPDAVAIPGWSHPGALAALSWCVEHSVPALLMSETQARDGVRHWWKETVKRRIIQKFGAALVGGTSHAEYLAGLGMPRHKIFKGYDVVDNHYFAVETAKLREKADGLRALLNLPTRFFLASARFVPKKNLAFLFKEYASYRARSRVRGGPLSLVLIGDGPQKIELLELRSRLNLRDHIILPGFIQYDQLPLYYGLATAFVHASQVEPWGLVVNEAAASSLPLILSRHCGCAPELLREGINGFGFDPDDEGSLAGAMHRMTRQPFGLSAMGKESLELVKKWPPSAFAEGLVKAAEAAMDTRPQKPYAPGVALLRSMAAGRALFTS